MPNATGWAVVLCCQKLCGLTAGVAKNRMRRLSGATPHVPPSVLCPPPLLIDAPPEFITRSTKAREGVDRSRTRTHGGFDGVWM
jgi:hypothetical protein